ncbi:UDP-3-O-(3-hydroxymyristoyl)glucosamine N-acyltransferase [soil metagenome]
MIAVAPFALGALRLEIGGEIIGDTERSITRVTRLADAGSLDLAPLLHGRYVNEAIAAHTRGAILLVDGALAARAPRSSDATLFIHPSGARALAAVLDRALIEATAPVIGEGCNVHPSAILGPRVVLGARVTVGPGAVIGGPGFGWVASDEGATRAMPQLGGVVIEDDVYIGPMCTIDSGTLAPTRVGRLTKLDAHVHVGHNVVLGEGCIVAAQAGFAGSVTLGRGVLVGGQAGFADHVTVGDGARIAAKAGVIGDVPAGAVVAGYPAIARARWLRGLAEVFRKRERKLSS